MKRALEAAERRKGGTSGLPARVVAKVIEGEIAGLPRDAQERLELLATRYQEKGTVKLARLIEDLVPPRFSGDSG